MNEKVERCSESHISTSKCQ